MIPTALGPLHVRRHGAGGPTVLLWHSLFLDGTSWDPVLPALSPGRSLLVVDGPCHGQSPGPGRRFTLEECADAALTLLDHAGIAQVDWVGNAWGGHVGVVLAARAPERVRRLAVVCSPMHALRPLERLRARVLAGLLGLAGWRGFLLKAVRGALLRAPMRPEVVAAVDGAAQAPGAARTLLAIRSVMLGRPSLVDRLPAVRAPTLFVAAEGSQVWPPALARKQATRLPNGRVEVIDWAGHIPPLENPTGLAGILTRFLAG